jgi:hypothetical protein
MVADSFYRLWLMMGVRLLEKFFYAILLGLTLPD